MSDVRLITSILRHFVLVEQYLPVTESCLSLLTTWSNSDGKDKSFLSVADSLRKIERKKLADWLSDTVFTQLSMEMKSCFLENDTASHVLSNNNNNNNTSTAVPSRRVTWQNNRSKLKYIFFYIIYRLILLIKIL